VLPDPLVDLANIRVVTRADACTERLWFAQPATGAFLRGHKIAIAAGSSHGGQQLYGSSQGTIDIP